MLLARLMDEHPGALRADLQQYYGIDLDHAMRGEHSAGHVAALAEHLPKDARVFVEVNGDARWTLTDLLLAAVVNDFNAWIYAHGDPKKRGRPPKIVGPESMRPKHTIPARTMTADELMRELSKPRR